MPLRLVGEEYSVVQGLDELGWLKEITRSATEDPALKIAQNGAGSALELFFGAVKKLQFNDDAANAGGWLRIYNGNGTQELALYHNGSNAVLSATGAPLTLIPEANYDAVLQVSGTGQIDLRAPIKNSGVGGEIDGRVDFQDDVVVGAGKLFRAGTAAAAPASPSAGDIYFDTAAGKLKVYNGTTWETVTSS
ncbi:MAG: hypothetical protein HYU86_08110 [Chloroflexi bacterium]|nr:hypothetical protein [Chloroflexota bacterium]